MPVDDLVHFLKARAKAAEPNGSGVSQLKREWLAELNSLFANIRKWLRKPLDAKLVRLEPGTRTLTEHQLGTYEAPCLTIYAAGPTVVDVLPQAREVVAAIGRVDLVCGPKREIMVRFNAGQWFFAQLSEEGTQWISKPVNETSFSAALKKLLS